MKTYSQGEVMASSHQILQLEGLVNDTKSDKPFL